LFFCDAGLKHLTNIAGWCRWRGFVNRALPGKSNSLPDGEGANGKLRQRGKRMTNPGLMWAEWQILTCER